MKYFFLALILTIAQPLPPFPRQTVDKQTEKSTAKSQISNNRQNAPDPSPSIVVTNNCANVDAGANAANNEASNLHPDSQKQPKPWSRSDKLTLAYDILTGILVVIALGTGIAVAFQAVKTAEATQSMRDSTAIQKTQLVQWLEIGEWNGGEDIWKPDDDKLPHHLTFTFCIINPTNYPMVLDRIEWEIDGQRDEQLLEGITFPPKGRHVTVAGYDLTWVQVNTYGDHGAPLTIDVSGTVHFRDVSKTSQVQPFWARLTCVHEKRCHRI